MLVAKTSTSDSREASGRPQSGAIVGVARGSFVDRDERSVTRVCVLPDAPASGERGDHDAGQRCELPRPRGAVARGRGGGGPIQRTPWNGSASLRCSLRTRARCLVADRLATVSPHRFAPHQLRHAHAVELARESVPLNVIQRQLGHANLGTTSIYLQGIDTEEIIATVHARRTR